MKLLKKSLPVFVLLLSLVIFSKKTLIAEALTVSPARIEVSNAAGEIVKGDFLVINEQGEDKTFYTSFENFESEGESGAPSFKPATEGLATWINAPEKVLVKKGEQKTVPFTITIPKDADAGGHFAAIFLSTTPTKLNNGNDVAVGAKIGVLILLRVDGDILVNGGISNFGTSNGSKFYTSLPVVFSYKFKNEGNDRVKPEGSLVIKNLLQLTSEKINANPTEGNILPKSTRKFDIIWGNAAEINSTSTLGFFGQARYQLKNFAFGPYTAALVLNYGVDSIAQSKLHVFVFPWQLTLIILIVLILIWLLLKKGIGSYNSYIIKKANSFNSSNSSTSNDSLK